MKKYDQIIKNALDQYNYAKTEQEVTQAINMIDNVIIMLAPRNYPGMEKLYRIARREI